MCLCFWIIVDLSLHPRLAQASNITLQHLKETKRTCFHEIHPNWFLQHHSNGKSLWNRNFHIFPGRRKRSKCRWHVKVQQPYIASHTRRCTFPQMNKLCSWFRGWSKTPLISTSHIPANDHNYTRILHSHVDFTLLNGPRHSQLSLFFVCLDVQL